MEFGGMVTQNPVPEKTFAVISGKTEGLRVNNVKKQGNLDIVKSKWIHDCIQAGRRLILNFDYIIFATPQTEQMIRSFTDEFGDSYVDELTENSIRSLLLREDWPKPEKAQTGSEQLVEEIKLRYLPDLM
jgi:DNA ligase-4